MKESRGDNAEEKVAKERKNQRKNYFIIDNDYVKFYARRLGVIATAVYTSLCMHSDYITKRCWPSMDTIAKEEGLERHAVSRALVKLEKWNIISIGRGIDRKFRRRKNNMYTLLPKESWKELPIEEDPLDEAPFGIVETIKHRGTKSTINVASKIPPRGIEDTSNKHHVTKIINQNTNCGQEPTVSVPIISDQTNLAQKQKEIFSVTKSEQVNWNYKEALNKLVNSDYKDYWIIGAYFYKKDWYFDNKQKFDIEFKRALKPANLLKCYEKRDILKAMDCCLESYGDRTGWTLETVLKRIPDYIANGFYANIV